MKEAQEKADLLVQAIKYIKKFSGKIVVVKCGGHAMQDETIKKSVFEDVDMLRRLGLKIVVVHGGGPEVDDEMKRQGLETKRVNGLRVTDAPTLEIVERIFSEINRDCTALLRSHGAKAADCTEGTLVTKITDPELGFVGEVIKVNIEKINDLLAQGTVPVVSCIGRDETGQLTNINADTAATHIAQRLNAEKLTILTNVDAVLDGHKEPISHLNAHEAEKYIKEGVIDAGMIPKVRACIEAAEHGVRKAHLLNGTVPRALLLEIFTDQGIGTEVVKI
ncbi:MAG TPA: acetylglutamate kinase [Candidatus Saccharimonadales bacterium]|nr:acetylglutamate kinase [Candidatus Saccharimonadales bacterium]